MTRRQYAAIVVGFLATRAWILGLDPLPYTDLNIYARYARESLEARANRMSLYAWHRLQAEAAAQAYPQEPSLAAPWRYRIEYPPLAVRWMEWIARGSGLEPGPRFRVDYVGSYRKTMLGVDLCVFAALLWWFRGKPWRDAVAGLGLYAGAGLPLAHLLYDRTDLLLGGLVAAGMLAAAAARSGATLAALVLGIHLKLAPAFLLPLWLLALPPATPRWRWATLAVLRGLSCVALVAAGFTWFVAVDGREALGFLAVQTSRDFEIGSGGASLLLVAEAMGADVRTIRTQASISLQTPWLPALSGVMLALQTGVVLLVTALFLRDRDRPAADSASSSALLPLATVATLLGVILTAKAFSPQYLLWLLPSVSLLLGSPAGSRGDALAFLSIAAVTTLVWPVLFQDQVIGRITVPGPIPELSGPTALGASLLVTRNLLATAWLWVLVRRLARAGGR